MLVPVGARTGARGHHRNNWLSDWRKLSQVPRAIKISSLRQILVAVEYQSTRLYLRKKSPRAGAQVWGKVSSYLVVRRHIALD